VQRLERLGVSCVLQVFFEPFNVSPQMPAVGGAETRMPSPPVLSDTGPRPRTSEPDVPRPEAPGSHGRPRRGCTAEDETPH
jgi:hypothetical protein